MLSQKYMSGRKSGLVALCVALFLVGLAQSAPTAHAQSRSFSIPDIYQIQYSGQIWQSDGEGLHSWSEIDNNPESFYLIARENFIYQVYTNDHTLWAANAAKPSTWTELDDNLATSEVAAGSNQLYQMHSSGSVWQYAGGGFHSWIELDDNSQTLWIVAGGSQLYQMHINGSVWQYDGGGFHSWSEIDNNPNVDEIMATETGAVYESRTLPGNPDETAIFQYMGGNTWFQLDNYQETMRIAVTDAAVYREDSGGTIWRYNGGGNWTELDDNPATSTIVAGGGQNDTLYQLRTDGSIWQYAGGGFHSWIELDDNPATMALAYPAERINPPT